MLKGYRTVLLHIAMTLAMGGTIQFTDLPPQAQHWLTLAAIVWGFFGILLRLVTTTPVGQQIEAKVESDLGITPEQMTKLLALLPQKADVTSLMEQGQKVIAAVEGMKTHPAASTVAQ